MTLLRWNPDRRALGFLLALIIGVPVCLFVVYCLGFGAMSDRSDTAPERLRDFTFPVWNSVSWLKHGFLVFLEADSFAKGEAYANHATFYLLMMRGLYALQALLPELSLRIGGAMLAMVVSVGALWWTVRDDIRRLCDDVRTPLLALVGFGYFMTMPTFWISLGKFNVDNGFVFTFPLLLISSVYLVRQGASGRTFWIASLLLCLMMPMGSALFATFVLMNAVFSPRMGRPVARAALILLSVSVLIYLQPVLVAKLLGFKSQNSTWLFRSGLDGDMSFYGNALSSVLSPQFNRPYYFIAVPVALLALQIAYTKWRLRHEQTYPYGIGHLSVMPYVFSMYGAMLLFWPQAVSIHPYLYDALLIGPISAWVVMNFASHPVFREHFVPWVFLMLFLIHFNLSKIAQAGACTHCYFPGWGMVGGQAG